MSVDRYPTPVQIAKRFPEFSAETIQTAIGKLFICSVKCNSNMNSVTPRLREQQQHRYTSESLTVRQIESSVAGY